MSETSPHRVLVTDVKMPFLSMVTFMVKWAIAAIPALLILMILGVVFWTLIIGLFSGIKSSLSQKTATEPSTSSLVSSSHSSKQAPKIDPAAAAYIANIGIKNVKVATTALDEPGVWGEIKNGGDRVLGDVEITIYCLGQDGKPVFEKQYHPVLVTQYGYGESNQPLKPGYSRQFGVRLNDAPSDWTKKVEVQVTSVAFQ